MEGRTGKETEVSGGLALLTYTTRPRGGVVHTLALAEALQAQGEDVTVVAIGASDDPGDGFFRPVGVPHVIIPPPPPAATLDERVFAARDALTAGLRPLLGEFDVLHAQDCISARSAAALRDEGAPVTVVRTVHHVDDFTSPALIDCQIRAIQEPDVVLVVSRQWQAILRDEHGVDAEVVSNGVDPARFPPIAAEHRAALRARVGADPRPLLLAVGGIEPRKGTRHLFDALGLLAQRLETPPVLAIVGGHSFQDYTAYRAEALARLAGHGLRLDRDVILLGTLSDGELAAWYRAADLFCCPSEKEGWGLVVLEAMAAGLPVVASDIPVFREYLTDGRDALLPPVADPTALADAIHRALADAHLRNDLIRHGTQVAARHTWEASATQHRGIYTAIRARRTSATTTLGPRQVPTSGS